MTGAWAALHQKQWDERRAFVEAALRAHRGNRTDTANAIGMERTYLVRLIRDMNIDVPFDPAQRSEKAMARWDRIKGRELETA